MTAPSSTRPAKPRRGRAAAPDAASAGPAAASPPDSAQQPRDGGADPADAQKRPAVGRRARWALSILIVAHLLAVFLPPLAFQTRGPLGASPSVTTLLAPLEGYGQFFYLDRGYAFFAPDPGPSHLVQVAARDDSGEIDEHMFPNLERQWPRLLYHRHFMLSEFLNDMHQPPGPPEELAEADPEQAEAWANARARFLSVHDSFVEHLEHEHPGKQIAIRRIEHVIPSFVDYVADPIPLDDPRLYNILLDRPRPPESVPPGVQPPGVQPPGVQPPGVQSPAALPPGTSPLGPSRPGEPPGGIPAAEAPEGGAPGARAPQAGRPRETAVPDGVSSP